MVQQLLRKFVQAVDTYPVFMAAATVGTTTSIGVGLLNTIGSSDMTHQRQYYEQQPHRQLTPKEAHFQAMIENAQQSTWKEKLQNVAVAQEHLLLGTDDELLGNGVQQRPDGNRRRERRGEATSSSSNFVNNIRDRSKEILRRNQEYLNQQREVAIEKDQWSSNTKMW